MRYEIPNEYFFPVRQIKPKFKFDVENVLVHMATEISKIPELPKRDFAKRVDEAVKRFPGNQTKKPKTIANWRTEISTLFGLIEYKPYTGECRPGRVAIKLADTQDVVEFFKRFLFFFGYPGGHSKPSRAAEFIRAGIKFKPVQYILKLLKYGEETSRVDFTITKAEVTHCIFNDLRVTRDRRPTEQVYDLIVSNREGNMDYDWEAQLTRYAKDILDYMVYADLLKIRSKKYYYLNPSASEAVRTFIESESYFDGYDPLYEKPSITSADVIDLNYKWFAYINQEVRDDFFKTSVVGYLHGLIEDEEATLPENIRAFLNQLEESGAVAQQIGDFGEGLIHGHECARITNGGREDIIHKIKKIPNQFAVGYDILSVELDERKRYVEVKTTISRDNIRFNQFHLSTNQWVVAEDCGERYFVYRLQISKEDVKLFLIQDPVGKYKTDVLRMIPRDGADIAFDDNAGEIQELLVWES